jgi:hypothetical protein
VKLPGNKIKFLGNKVNPSGSPVTYSGNKIKFAGNKVCPSGNTVSMRRETCDDRPVIRFILPGIYFDAPVIDFRQ